MRHMVWLVAYIFGMFLCYEVVWAQEESSGEMALSTSRPLNLDTQPLVSPPSPGTVGPVMPVVSNGEADMFNDLSAMADISPLVLNRIGRSASGRRIDYDGENEFWLFDGRSRVLVNSGNGRVCVTTGSYRICHSR